MHIYYLNNPICRTGLKAAVKYRKQNLVNVVTSGTLIFSVEESIQRWLNTDFISIVKYLFFLFKILHYLKVTYSIPKDLLLQMAIVQYFPLLRIKVNLKFP